MAHNDNYLRVRYRTLKASTYSTLVLPAGISSDEMKAALDDGVKVYKVSNYTESTLTFTEFTGTTTASVPVVVYRMERNTSRSNF